MSMYELPHDHELTAGSTLLAGGLGAGIAIAVRFENDIWDGSVEAREQTAAELQESYAEQDAAYQAVDEARSGRQPIEAIRAAELRASEAGTTTLQLLERKDQQGIDEMVHIGEGAGVGFGIAAVLAATIIGVRRYRDRPRK